MEIREAKSRADLNRFLRLPHAVYRNDPLHRSTEDDLAEMLVGKRSRFFLHAEITSYLISENGTDVGRFSLIHDRKLPDCVQVGFFDFLPGVVTADAGPYALIKETARRMYPGVPRIVVGMQGHLNYSIGFLESPFDRPPVFGLPYTPRYYLDFFAGLEKRRMHSFAFESQIFYTERFERFRKLVDPAITVRYLDKRNLARDTAIYTGLNNACFKEHPYWSDRTPEEDYELFHAFAPLLDSENFIFAFDGGRPVGFLLWYPDFNELVGNGRRLGLLPLLRFRLGNPMKTFRFTEVAILPEYAHRPVVLSMIFALQAPILRGGYTHCEGGFIFEENTASMNMALRFITRATGNPVSASRRFVVFEDSQ